MVNKMLRKYGRSGTKLTCAAARQWQGPTTLIAALAALVCVSAPAVAQSAGANAYGTYRQPFSADSLWNSRPVRPKFGSFEIPTSEYVPLITDGEWSTGVFEAKQGDSAVTVKGLPGSPGLWLPDAETHGEVTIPRWPDGVTPATASDGHADIVDPVAGKIHSFWKLRQEGTQWVAAQYAWTRLEGRGWGNPAHYFQGARAAAVPTSGGLIRKHEIDDGDVMYRHALAMSLTFNGLAANPGYIFPATSADHDAKKNTGEIPQGALLMLPPSFDLNTIRDERVRKVAETLKVYGAYVVDRNHGTPFVIYVENGADFSLHKGGWNSVAADDLDRIRAGLRQVTSTVSWLDGNGKYFNTDQRMNLLSMRGPWKMKTGTRAGVFDSWEQAVVFTPGSTVEQINDSGRVLHSLHWAKPVAGQAYRLSANTTGGGALRLRLIETSNWKTVYDSGNLTNGRSVRFSWPGGKIRPVVHAISGAGSASTVSGELIRVE